MWSVTLTERGPEVLAADPPSPQAGEALLQLRLGGVCATDLELCRGYLGFRGTLGHEFVADVIDAPDPAWLGARVVGEINSPCRVCPTCRAGRSNHCPHRDVLGIAGRPGAFATHFTLPLANLHRVPDAVSDEGAVFTEPLAAACEIAEQVHLRPTSRVAVLGSGRLGQLCARVLALTGAEVGVVGRNAATLARLPAHVRRWAPADAAGADVVVDCTGAPEGLTLATGLVRPRGTIVLKTTVHAPELPPINRWVIDEIRVIGSRCGPFEPALRLLSACLIDPTPLITARFALRDGVAALRQASLPGALKVLLDPEIA